MSAILLFLLVIFGGAAMLVLFVVGLYNGLVQARNAYKNAFAQIDVQLNRRYDLIPNLVEVAKTYMAHERETLEAVIRARAAAIAGLGAAKASPGDADAMAKLSGAESGLGAALGRLMMVSEAYPDLKANQNMAQLTEELTSTENKVAFARQAYNDQVLDFNNEVGQFPDLVVARLAGFAHMGMLESTQNAQERAVPQVKF